jgi:hypothetical protein
MILKRADFLTGSVIATVIARKPKNRHYGGTIMNLFVRKWFLTNCDL